MYLCNLRITRKKSPVDICSISDIRVVIFSRSRLKNSLHQSLRLVGFLEKEFDYSCKDLQLCLLEY